MEFPLDQLVAVLVVARVDDLAAVAQAIERRHRQIEMAVLDQLRHLPVEERDEQRRDMGAVDVGVRHHNHLLIAQILLAIVRAGAGAERLHEIGELLVLRELLLAGGGDIEDFPAQRQHRLRGSVARLLGRAAGRVAFDDEDFRALRGGVGAVGELAGQPQFAHRGLARILLLLPATNSLFGALDHEIEELVRLRRVAGEPVIERVAHRVLDDAGRFRARQPILGLALEFRLAHEHGDHAGGPAHHVVAGQQRRAFCLAQALGVILDAFQQHAAQPGFVGSPVGRRDRIAIRR